MELLALGLFPNIENVLNILLVAVGLGLVIFIHELGHFAVAKWCGVKVERFSIGFGPILWRVTRGETEYALSAIPFGGYVKMLGQDDSDPSQMADERISKDPRSYTSKTVPQRIAIISAGVINNLISAVLFFIVAFMLGVKYQPAVVGQATPGKPAWVAGLRLGDKLLRIGKTQNRQLSFMDVRRAVALSQQGEVLEIEGERDGKPFRTSVEPATSEEMLVPTIFLEPDQGLTLLERKGAKGPIPTAPGLSASRAEPPLMEGDQIREIDGEKLHSFSDLKKALAIKRAETVELAVHRKGEKDTDSLTRISLAPNHFRTLGLRMAIGKIKAIQRNSPAEKDLRTEDTITHIQKDGEFLRVGPDIDPLTLPDFFAERAGTPVVVRLKREVTGGNPTTHEFTLAPENRQGWIEAPDHVDDCPLSIPAIGVAFHVLNHVVGIDEGGPAEKAGILKEDIVQSISFALPQDAAEDAGSREAMEFKFDEKERNWPQAFWYLQHHPLRTVELSVKSLGSSEVRKVQLEPIEVADWYVPFRGFGLQELSEIRRAQNVGEAVLLGFAHTRDTVIDMWFTIRNLISGRISPKALGGPIRIGEAAYQSSKHGLPDLILFLGLLSVNLAVFNFLPIPVLDGGHFVFLCWEGIRGKPPSEKIVVTATYFGLALVLSLMVWVLFMDFSGLVARQ